MSAAVRPRHASGKFANRTVARVIRVRLALKTPYTPTATAAPNNTSTIRWKFTPNPATCATPKMIQELTAAKKETSAAPAKPPPPGKTPAATDWYTGCQH